MKKPIRPVATAPIAANLAAPRVFIKSVIAFTLLPNSQLWSGLNDEKGRQKQERAAFAVISSSW
jgi:hypothetical protein